MNDRQQGGRGMHEAGPPRGLPRAGRSRMPTVLALAVLALAAVATVTLVGALTAVGVWVYQSTAAVLP